MSSAATFTAKLPAPGSTSISSQAIVRSWCRVIAAASGSSPTTEFRRAHSLRIARDVVNHTGPGNDAAVNGARAVVRPPIASFRRPRCFQIQPPATMKVPETNPGSLHRAERRFLLSRSDERGGAAITARRTPCRHRSTCYSDSRRARSCDWRSEDSHTARSLPSTSRGSPKRSNSSTRSALFRRSSGTWLLRRSRLPRPPIQECRRWPPQPHRPHGPLGPSPPLPRCLPRGRRVRSLPRRPPVRPRRSHRGRCHPLPPSFRPCRCYCRRYRRLPNHRSLQPRCRHGLPNCLPWPMSRRHPFRSPRRRRPRRIPNRFHRPPGRWTARRRKP